MIRQGKYTKKVSLIEKVKRRSKRRWRWFSALPRRKKFLLIAAPILAFLILTPLLTYLYFWNDISDRERLMNRNNTGVVVTDRNNKVIYSTGRAEHRAIVPLGQIADVTENALIASEDNEFYDHNGFSVGGIMRAVYGVVTDQPELGGGSTLTQQLAKNTLLSSQRTFLRKYQELAISIAIEQQYSKDEILTMYLNSVYFGENAFGIEDAADTYFNKAPSDLTLAESAMLIGVLPAPSAYSPISGSKEYAKDRQETVLSRMVDNGMISKAEKESALAAKLTYAPQEDPANNLAPHFSQMVLNQLEEKYGEERAVRSGYQVKTTLDMSMQQKLLDSVKANMAHIQLNGGTNASAVAIDPTTGEIRALVGSADWTNPDWGKVNMVTTPRQPGSSFKPIYYAEALAEGVVTPATILEDVPTNFNGYEPLNADRTFSGDISVRNALSRSLNIPSVKVMRQLGIQDAIDAAQRMGITLDEDKNYGLSLALGTAEATLLEMTNAYAAFANQGTQYNTTIIKQINNKYDSAIFTSQSVNQPVQSPQGSYLISDILSDATARAPVFGSSLSVPGRSAAVKTGTTDDNRDAWTIGYTPQLAVGVWVGNNDNTVMQNGGSSMAGPIWVNAMSQMLAGRPPMSFTVPAGVIEKPVCIGTAALASSAGYGTYMEYFLASALPTDTCSPREPPKEDKEKKPENDEAPTEEETTEEPLPGETDPTNPGNGNDSGSGTGGDGGNTGGDGGGETGGDGDSDGGGGDTTTPIGPQSSNGGGPRN